MKRLAKWILARIAASDTVCRALLPVLREIERQRRSREAAFVGEAVAGVIPELRVRSGPFRGLAYPAAESLGSVLFPKLVGSYERELQPAIGEILAVSPTGIVDIGCAEGYYAVGLAMRVPEARVFAFDTNPEARNACRRMAEFNGAGERVVVAEHCSAEQLVQLPLGAHGLVISDCEGAERWIFTEEVAEALRPHHLVIELHDFAQPGTGALLEERLRRTHDVSTIAALDDQEKVRQYRYDELASFTDRQRARLLREGRPAAMSWLVCKPVTEAAEPPRPGDSSAP